MKIRADIIKKALSKKHSRDFFLTEVKNGPTHIAAPGELLILDALAIKRSWTQPRITGYEIKVSRQDFNKDEKWPGYLKYCHYFNFVCPRGLIQPEELPDEVGLIWYNQEKDSLYTRRKAVFRDIEISADLLWYIIICRLESGRHPFFSSVREYFQAWVEDRAETRELGYRVGTKLVRELKKAIKEKEVAERKLKRYESDVRELEQIREIAQTAGISRWRLVEGIREALTFGVTSRIEAKVNTIIREAEKLKEMISGEQEAG